MTITVSHLLTASDATDQTDYTTASITPTANRLVIVCYQSRRADSVEPDLPTVTGNGLTYTHIDNLSWDTSGATRKRTFLFAANSGGSPSAGGITFDHATGPATHGAWSIFEADGTDVANGVVQCFVQIVKVPADTTGTSLSLTLASASHANNRPFCMTVRANAPDAAPGTSWTELGDSAAVDGARLHTQWRSDAFDTAVATTWDGSSQEYGGIAWELKDAAAGGAASLGWILGSDIGI